MLKFVFCIHAFVFCIHAYFNRYTTEFENYSPRQVQSSIQCWLIDQRHRQLTNIVRVCLVKAPCSGQTHNVLLKVVSCVLQSERNKAHVDPSASLPFSRDPTRTSRRLGAKGSYLTLVRVADRIP